MPFFAGLVMTVRKIGIEKKDVPVAKTFFGTVKENFKAFLLHGVVTYAIIACSIFAFMYYFSLLGFKSCIRFNAYRICSVFAYSYIYDVLCAIMFVTI